MAGALDNAKDFLPKIADSEKESEYGQIFAVSGPGKYLKLLLCVK